jgi:hypothetical protein
VTKEQAVILSERATNTLKHISKLSQLYYQSQSHVLPYLLRLSKKPKNPSFSIDLKTSAHSKNLIVTNQSAKNVLLLVQLHPLKNLDSTSTGISELIEDLHFMANNQSNLRNTEKLSGRMSGIGWRGGYEDGKSAGSSTIPTPCFFNT